MKVVMTFRNGSRRVVQLHPSFNQTTEIRRGQNTIRLTPKQKTEDLSHVLGYRPYMVDVIQNGKPIIHIENPKNAPYTKLKVKNQQSPEEIKLIKKQCKGFVFTVIEKKQF